MSRAQKLVNWALEILARQKAEGLNDQKTLVELRTLFRDKVDHGQGTASNMVKETQETLAKHLASELTDRQAMQKVHSILEAKKQNDPATKKTK